MSVPNKTEKCDVRVRKDVLLDRKSKNAVLLLISRFTAEPRADGTKKSRCLNVTRGYWNSGGSDKF